MAQFPTKDMVPQWISDHPTTGYKRGSIGTASERADWLEGVVFEALQ